MTVGPAVLISRSPYTHRVEIGPWLDAGTKRGPLEVATHLKSRNANYTSGRNRYCIYIHVPFCSSRCTYCALYTFALKRNQIETMDRYLEAMHQMIASHPNVPALFCPTTVHFGGGTPLVLGTKRFAMLVGWLRQAFGDSQDCEWAVETTTSSMDAEMTHMLHDLNVRRVHLGIQTLNENIRKKIKRRESGEKAVERIRFLKAGRFRLSVDLLIGLENQTEDVVWNDLETLYRSGIRMFSVCELRTMKPESSDKESEEKNSRLWSLLWKFMEQRGLAPIHLGQFGKSFHDNLYYTHPARGEDCVALGPYAHGSAGNMVYANLLLKEYYKGVRDRLFPVRFGVSYDSEEAMALRLERELLAHRVRRATVEELQARFGKDFLRLWESWLEQRLLLEFDENGSFQPSMKGSWYIGNMIQDSRRLVSGRGSKEQIV